MASENAKAVARKVIDNLRKSKKINLGKIIREQGYSESVATAPQNVTDTDSYQEEIAPFLERLVKKRDEAMLALTQEKIDTAGYHQLVSAIDIFTKNIQLLSGEETERKGITVNIVSYKDADTDTV